MPTRLEKPRERCQPVHEIAPVIAALEVLPEIPEHVGGKQSGSEHREVQIGHARWQPLLFRPGIDFGVMPIGGKQIAPAVRQLAENRRDRADRREHMAARCDDRAGGAYGAAELGQQPGPQPGKIGCFSPWFDQHRVRLEPVQRALDIHM